MVKGQVIYIISQDQISIPQAKKEGVPIKTKRPHCALSYLGIVVKRLA